MKLTNGDISKTSKVANVMMNYLLQNGANDISMNLRHTDTLMSMIFKTDYIQLSPEDISCLERLLNVGYREEYDDYYSDIPTEVVNWSDLALVGSMIDEGFVNYDEGLLKLDLRYYYDKY
ncbi:MAG: hypothetical protein WCI30_03905 [Clostridia bacterium]